MKSRTTNDMAHRNRGSTCTLRASLHRASLTAKQEHPSFLFGAQRARTQPPRTLAPRRASTPSAERVAAHAPPLHQRLQPQDDSTRPHAALRSARTTPTRIALLPPVAASPAPDTTHDQRRTTTKRCRVPERTQRRRRRRSMGHGRTGR